MLPLMQERILEMSRRYEALQREADASAEALLRATADVQRLEADCTGQRQQLADNQEEITRLNGALHAAKVSETRTTTFSEAPGYVTAGVLLTVT